MLDDERKVYEKRMELTPWDLDNRAEFADWLDVHGETHDDQELANNIRNNLPKLKAAYSYIDYFIGEVNNLSNTGHTVESFLEFLDEIASMRKHYKEDYRFYNAVDDIYLGVDIPDIIYNEMSLVWTAYRVLKGVGVEKISESVVNYMPFRCSC